MSKLDLELYKKLYLIRRAEQGIVDNYADDEMKTPMHMSLGGEAIQVGVCSALKKTDRVYGTYRSHALYLAKSDDTDAFFAELYGKEAGAVRGRGGSMHLADPVNGVMTTSAVVASNLPVAIGDAFANQQKKNGGVTAVFFGDGAVEEGAFWESLNVASLMKLPILFVCEDNGLAIHSAKDMRHGYRSLTGIISKFNCKVYKSETTDVSKIYDLTKKVLAEMKRTKMPVFLDLKYHRYLEHVGVNEDYNAGYRSRDELIKWKRVDPLVLQKRRLLKSGLQKKVTIIEQEMDRKIEESIAFAKKAKFPDPEDLYKDIFYEKK